MKGGGTELGSYRSSGDTTAHVSSAMTNIVTNVGNICGSVATTSNAAGNPTFDVYSVNNANYLCGPPSPGVNAIAELTNGDQGVLKTRGLIVQVCN
jgi:hypothetical protein